MEVMSYRPVLGFSDCPVLSAPSPGIDNTGPDHESKRVAELEALLRERNA